jgi:hypothetical protein
METRLIRLPALAMCDLHRTRCNRGPIYPRWIMPNEKYKIFWICSIGVCSRKVLSAPRGCQRLGRVGSANCRPGRRFLSANVRGQV